MPVYQDRECVSCGTVFTPRRSIDLRCHPCAVTRRRTGSAGRRSRTPEGKSEQKGRATTRGIHDQGFTGVDGEGINRLLPDGTTRHEYVYMCAVTLRPDGSSSKSDLWQAGRRLHTDEMLAWLWNLPRSSLWWYSAKYDWTMILADLPREIMEQVWPPEAQRIREGADPFEPVRYKQWGIVNVQGAVTLVNYAHGCVDKKTGKIRYPEKFFADGFRCWNAGSFVSQLKNWQIVSGPELEHIENMKEQRSHFTECDQKIRDYCASECLNLAKLARTIVTTAADLGIRPSRGRWYSAGSMAKALLRSHKIDTFRGPDRYAGGDKKIRDILMRSYFGGRFETSATGIFQKLWQRDLASAYPAAIKHLPCLAHGRWVREYHPGASVRFARASWSVRDGADPLWGPLPWRSPKQAISFPVIGEGWYCETELDAARELDGYDWEIIEWLCWVPDCDHQPFTWIQDVYDQRQALGKNGKGLVLKVAMNSIYGTTADTVSSTTRYGSVVWAAMITADCRAKILRALRDHPREIVSIATDGILATAPVLVPDDVPPRKILGEWDSEGTVSDVLLIQPGLLLSAEGGKPKSRGHAWRDFQALEPALRKAWEHDAWNGEVTYERTRFMPGKLSLRRTDFHGSYGQWVSEEVTIAFMPSAHRRIAMPRRGGQSHAESRPWAAHLLTKAPPLSSAYDKLTALEAIEPLTDEKELDDAQP